MVSIKTGHISVGGNRHPAAGDWDPRSGSIAFGADNNVALWDPLLPRGVYALLSGHTGKVNAVKFLPGPSWQILLTGSVDHTIRVWRAENPSPPFFKNVATLDGHESSVNAFAVLEGSDFFVSGAADATVKIWKIEREENIKVSLVQTVVLKPRFFPLALALKTLKPSDENQGMVLAVGGTGSTVQLYVSQNTIDYPNFQLQATLTGHEGWIRSLAFCQEADRPDSDVLLASASQDKYIRLWRIHEGEGLPAANRGKSDPSLGSFAQSLSNKTHRIGVSGLTHSVTFEALLLGHEDWVYTASWNPNPRQLQLLSASADNSLAVWEPDPDSGVWLCIARLGEIIAQKGSTSATGSPGGFWIGLWSGDGGKVVSLGKTGSWRRWSHDSGSGQWLQSAGISGHVKTVTGIRWEERGSFLLSTSLDQTTRLYAELERDGKKSWHEFARPQIHGYNINCIDTLGALRFISGADEKLLRVFDQPRAIADLLQKLCGIKQSSSEEMPAAANIPVLGLSNKAIEADDANEPMTHGNTVEQEPTDPSSERPKSGLDLDDPPFEDHLARHTLWPEHEKLYGHGYEISAVATSRDHSIVATACKASSIDHAVIRLYHTSDWHEIRPPLTAHSLTVTSLCFSDDDKMLLSTGRDRQWVVFERDLHDNRLYTLSTSNPKGHSRMILDAAWAPLPENEIFATAGRDKLVKIWQRDEKAFVCKVTIPASNPVTSVAFLPSVIRNKICLAAGEENGNICIHEISVNTIKVTNSFSLDKEICPSKSVTDLAWRPTTNGHSEALVVNGNGTPQNEHKSQYELAVASEDSSLRIYVVSELAS